MINLKNEKGQAIIEFVLFLPLMLILYSMVMTIGNSINGAINQQKVTRSYFYFRVQNNSYVPKPFHNIAGNKPYDAWTFFGLYMFGWRENLIGQTPTATCYRLRLPLAEKQPAECDEPYSDQSSQFIKVATAYGICGANFNREDDVIKRGPIRRPSELVQNSCQIR